jgi:hypothetical protein
MQGIAARAARDIEQLINTQVALAGSGRANGIGFVGKTHVRRGAIDIAEDGDVLYAEFAARAKDAYRDFPAIGNKDFPEHGDFCNWREFTTRLASAKE